MIGELEKRGDSGTEFGLRYGSLLAVRNGRGIEFGERYGPIAVRSSAKGAERLQYGMHSGNGMNSANGTERLRYELRLLRYVMNSVSGSSPSTEFGLH